MCYTVPACVEVCVVDVIDAAEKDLHLLYMHPYYHFYFAICKSLMMNAANDDIGVIYKLLSACSVVPASLLITDVINDARFTG